MINISIKSMLYRYYGYFLSKKSFLKFNRLLFQLSLRGLGILNYENDTLSGEIFFLRSFLKDKVNPMVLDIGAHIGNYSNTVKSLCPSATIYAFEPHPRTFQKLRVEAFENGYTALNLGCGDMDGTFVLYDYQRQDTISSGSSHASLFSDIIQGIHKADSKGWNVQITTVDAFIESSGIEKVDLLKIDTEGNEYKVLQGASKSIEEGKIDAIQFEFNEMNIVSRVFLKDFIEILPSYFLYRLLPYDFVPLENYVPVSCEIFAYQNIVAIRKDIFLKNSGYKYVD
jgi:FkbM family methyltransferase